jgi:acyl carrier protein
MLVDLVTAQTAVVLGYASGSEVNPGQPFTDLGFDSLSAVEFRNGLSALVGLALPATLVFDFPTPQEVAAMLHAAMAGKPASVSESILADLDRLEGMLAGLQDADEALREKVAGRLEVLRTRWSARRGNGGAEPGANVDLGSASDDEVFNLLDQQLGLS